MKETIDRAKGNNSIILERIYEDCKLDEPVIIGSKKIIFDMQRILKYKPLIEDMFKNINKVYPEDIPTLVALGKATGIIDQEKVDSYGKTYYPIKGNMGDVVPMRRAK